jgi:GTP-sensing pleiotropic transcriptional regulator CodY
MLSSNDLSSLITDMQDKLPSNLFSVPDIANNILPDASDPSFLSAKSAILSSNFNVLGGSLMDKLNINKLPSNFTTALFSNSFSNSINNLLDVGSLKSSSKLTGTVLSLFSNSLTNLIDFHSNIDITDKSAFVTDIGKSSLDNGWKKIEPYIDESERDSTYNALRDSFYSELTKQYNDVSIAKWWV